MREMLLKAERRRKRWTGRSWLIHWEEAQKRELCGSGRVQGVHRFHSRTWVVMARVTRVDPEAHGLCFTRFTV